MKPHLQLIKFKKHWLHCILIFTLCKKIYYFLWRFQFFIFRIDQDPDSPLMVVFLWKSVTNSFCDIYKIYSVTLKIKIFLPDTAATAVGRNAEYCWSSCCCWYFSLRPVSMINTTFRPIVTRSIITTIP